MNQAERTLFRLCLQAGVCNYAVQDRNSRRAYVKDNHNLPAAEPYWANILHVP